MEGQNQNVELSPEVSNKLVALSKNINLDKLFEEIIEMLNKSTTATISYCNEKMPTLYGFLKKETLPEYNLDKLFNIIVNTFVYGNITKDDYETFIYEIMAMSKDITATVKKPLSYYQNKYKYLYISYNYIFELIIDKYFIDGINFNSTKIMLDVIDIQENYNVWKTKRLNISPKQFEENMKEKHMYLYTAANTIFKKAIGGGFSKTEDIETLEYIFNKAKKIKKGVISQSDADKEIGAKFGDKYLPKNT